MVNEFELAYQSAYSSLNKQQRKAVETIEGPVLVIAGPGTGKTQLLATRVAYILKNTDTLPSSIVCLTFTESGALAMRERLASMIGESAYEIRIFTYHAFGSDIIRNNPEFFENLKLDSSEDERLERPIDEITKHQLLASIVASLPYDDPLKSTSYHLGDLIATISELKRALIDSKKLRQLYQENSDAISRISPLVNACTKDFASFPSTIKKALPLFMQIHEVLENDTSHFAKSALIELESSIEAAEQSEKSTPLTKWKNNWLYKLADGSWSFTDPKLTKKLLSLANVLDMYQEAMREVAFYDFDDMILRAIEALKTNEELRFNVQEQYLYVLLDEFQDTNPAQFELVKLLTDNPVHEGRPNILAVGDDDQAIYAFQGADVSNMLQFVSVYKDVAVIPLSENYRSHHTILHVAHGIADQIETRLHKQLPNITKTITAAGQNLPNSARIERHEFKSRALEYAWVAREVALLIASGVDASSIAVLAPKHSHLESMVPYLNNNNVAVSYEKRENILETEVVKLLRLMVELLSSIHSNNMTTASQYLATLFSMPQWGVPVEVVWQVNWQTAKQDEERNWLEIALGQSQIRKHVLFFLSLAGRSQLLPLEEVLDILTGTQEYVFDGELYVSPLFDFYFSKQSQNKNPQLYFETITHLSVIREKIRSYLPSDSTSLTIDDFLRFLQTYEAAEQSLLNTHPIAQSDTAVQLMTAYRSKGLEFDTVFLLQLQDSAWGMSARTNNNKLTLPRNLSYIRYRGASEDERKRLLYVAVTRAKHTLLLTSHVKSDAGKMLLPLKYLQEIQSENKKLSTLLPVEAQSIKLDHETDSSTELTKAITLAWHQPATRLLSPDLRSLLSERLEKYVMSPTHLNTFIDLVYGGPEQFLLYTLLRFPKAPSPDGEFGSAVHETFDWAIKQHHATGSSVSIEGLETAFLNKLKGKSIKETDLATYIERGKKVIKSYGVKLLSEITENDVSEHDFRSEGIVIDGVKLSGKIDRMIVDKNNKEIIIIDFKTGQQFSKWTSDLKLTKYKQQLYLYKLLIEHSRTYKGYRVTAARLDFVEPDDNGRNYTLELSYDDNEQKSLLILVKAVWQRIIQLDLPDTSAFDASKKGSDDFIRWLTTS